MAKVRASHKMNQAAVKELISGPDGAFAKDLLKRGIKVQARARRNLGGGVSGPRRINTGHLRSSIGIELRTVDVIPAVRIGSNVKSAKMVHDGTGLYGPKKQVIRPKHRKALRWKGKSGFIFAKYVRGMRANTYLSSALPAARVG